MASWMVHFRIADALLDEIGGDAEQFIVGNIGPDCGEPNEDWSSFTPSSEISHWNTGKSKRGIQSEAFFDRYIKDQSSDSRYHFYLGYYVHLLTDKLWSSYVYEPTAMKYQDRLEQDSGFIWVIKEDWYDLDARYLREHPDFRTFRIFEGIRAFPNIYLDYYSETAIEKRIQYIANFYRTYEGDLDREYQYLSEEQMDAFVAHAVEEIRKDLRSKGLIQERAGRME